MSIKFKQKASVDTPPSGHATMYVDASDNIKVKKAEEEEKTVVYSDNPLLHEKNKDTKMDEGGSNEITAETMRNNIDISPLDAIAHIHDDALIRSVIPTNPTPYDTLVSVPTTPAFVLGGSEGEDAFMLTKAFVDQETAHITGVIDGGDGGNFISFEKEIGYFPGVQALALINGVTVNSPDGKSYTFGWDGSNLTINNGMVTHSILISNVASIGTHYSSLHLKTTFAQLKAQLKSYFDTIYSPIS